MSDLEDGTFSEIMHFSNVYEYLNNDSIFHTLNSKVLPRSLLDSTVRNIVTPNVECRCHHINCGLFLSLSPFSASSFVGHVESDHATNATPISAKSTT